MVIINSNQTPFFSNGCVQRVEVEKSIQHKWVNRKEKGLGAKSEGY